MPYSPNNNPYIPGDPYAYDLKWIVFQIKKAIAEYIALNGRADALDGKLAALTEYVHNYFDNLDISEEVGNKIDEMAADGSLETLIAPYIAEVLAAGLNFYGAKVSYEHYNTGAYWLVKMPRVSVDGERRVLKVGISDGTVTSPSWITDPQTVSALSAQKKATIAVNGGFFQRANNDIPWGSVIIDGQIMINQYDTHTSPLQTLGIKSDGSWSYYDSDSVSAIEMVDDGVIYALSGLGPVVSRGAQTANLAIWEANYGRGVWQSIGCDDDYYYIVTSEKEFGTEALNLREISEIYLALGAQEAYILDSGGSTSTCIDSIKLNKNLDDAGLADRPVATFLYISKPDISDAPDYDEDVALATALGLVLGRMNAEGAKLAHYRLTESQGDLSDCDDLPLNSIGYTYSSTANSPGPYYHVFTFGDSETLKVQFAIRHTDNIASVRGCVGSTWTTWTRIPPWRFIGSSADVDLDTLPVFSMYYATAVNTGKPDSGNWEIMTFGSPAGSYPSQLAVRQGNGKMATRARNASNVWTDWAVALPEATFRNEIAAAVTTSVNNASTGTLADIGAITDNGYYYVMILRTGSNLDDVMSAYTIRYNSGTFSSLGVIHQSAVASGPKLSNTGVLTTVSTTSSTSMAIKVMRIS